MKTTEIKTGGLAGLLALLVVLAWNIQPQPAMATDYLTSGHICDAYAPNVQGRFIRKRDGIIKNISSDRDIVVSCPIITDLDDQFFDVLVTSVSLANAPYNFNCSLRLFDATGFNLLSVMQSVVVNPGSGNAIIFDDFERTDQLDRIDLICTLPPKSSIDVIGVDSSNPA